MYIKNQIKKLVILIFSILLFVGLFCVSMANNIIYINSKDERISTGTILKEYEILTDDGWVEAQVLEIDLSDKYTKLQLLTSEEGNHKLDSVMNMAKTNNSIGAINGDFFAGNKGIGSSIGISINNGILNSSGAEDNRSKEIFTSFLLNDEGKIFYDYIRDEIVLKFHFKKEEFTTVARYVNKYTDNTDFATVYTRDFGEYSIGSTEILPVTEVVVENNKVSEVRINKEPVEIPENGYVVMCTGKVAEELNNLEVGSKVDFFINYVPNIEKINFAISGGTKLIENGIVPESYSHNVSGRNPRTVIGSSKDNTKVYLITIDGRSKKSIGMTLEEVSNFLQKINVYSAINLDGGGSTTMVAKRLGNINLEEINNPSGGTERLVANGVGVSSDAPSSDKLSALKINIQETNIFQGEKTEINVVGYNKYYEPLEINSGDIVWDYEGVDVTIESGEIVGNTVGEAKIFAKIGKIETEQKIKILSPCNEIFIYPKEIAIKPDEKVAYTLQAKNKNGEYSISTYDTYTSNIENYYNHGIEEDIPEGALIDNNVFSSNISGTYIISFSKGNCKTFAKVSVADEQFNLVEDFEKKNFTFDPYPDEVGGDAIWSNEQKYDGEYSAKLEYDFDRDAVIRGAYIVFDEEPIIPKNATKLAFWVYNDGYKEEKLKTKMIDGNGDVRILILEETIPHEGWQEIKYDISNMVLPLRITDVYVAQNDENIRNKGEIYVDNLGYYTSKLLVDDSVRIPKDIKLEDEDNVSIKSENSFDISFLKTISEPELFMDVLKTKTLLSKINKETDLTIFTNSINQNYKDRFFASGDSTTNSDYYCFEIKKLDNKILFDTGYDLFSNDYCTIIMMDISQNGVRKSDGSQFENLKLDVKDDETGNVILVLNSTIDNFSDLKERKIFVDMLHDLKEETKKNIYVVHDGFYNDFSMERGVKFLGITELSKEYENSIQDTFLIISINNKEISYEYRKVL